MIGHAGPHKSQVSGGEGLGHNLLAGLNSIANRSGVRVPKHFPNLANAVGVFLHAGEDFHPISRFDALSVNFNPQRRADTDAHFTVMQKDKRSQRTIAAPNPLARYHTASHGNIFRMNPIVIVFRPPGIVSISWIGFHDLDSTVLLTDRCSPITQDYRQSLYRVRYQAGNPADFQPRSQRGD